MFTSGMHLCIPDVNIHQECFTSGMLVCIYALSMDPGNGEDLGVVDAGWGKVSGNKNGGISVILSTIQLNFLKLQYKNK